MSAQKVPLRPIVACGLCGAICLYFGMLIGEADTDLPRATGPDDSVEAFRALVSNQAEITSKAMSSLQASLESLRQLVERQNSKREDATPRRNPGLEESEAAGERALLDLPVASELDAQRLSALPHRPTDKNAVDGCLSRWSQEHQALAYLSIEEVVARFGIPSRASAKGHFIEWRYDASGSVEGRAGAFILRVVRSRVVEAIAMP